MSIKFVTINDMEIDNIDFDDTSLGEMTSIDDVVDTTLKSDAVTPPADPATPPVDEAKSKKGETKSKKAAPAPVNPPIDSIKDEKGDTDESNDSEESDEVGEGFIKGIAKKIGIELGDDEDFEDSEDGLVAFTQRAADSMADAKLNGYFASLPSIAGDFFDYCQMLGEDATEENIKAFFNTVNPEINYAEVDLDNTDVQKAVMKTFYKKMDYTDEEIKDAIDDLEIADTLRKQSEVASKKLGAIQTKERAGLLEQERQAESQRKENTKAFFGNIKNVIDSGKVNNFTIPVTEKRAIFDYDTQGEFMKDLNSILKDPSKRVELAIAVKNKFNLGKYVQAAAATQKANTLSAKLRNSVGTGKNGASGQNVSNNSIDWDSI
jgi:hypothetical protein